MPLSGNHYFRGLRGRGERAVGQEFRPQGDFSILEGDDRMTHPSVGATTLRFREHVIDAHGYVPEWLGLDRSRYLRLDRNESTLPIPDNVTSILAEYLATRGVHTYPEAERLSKPLATYCGVSPACILPTNGSDQAIDLCLRSFLGEGDRMLVARPEFSIFSHIAALTGALVEGVSYKEDLSFPYEQFSQAAAACEPDLIVIINPNNPTGTAVEPDFIRMIASRYAHVPVIVDEAYYEYTDQTAVGLIRSHENIIVLRTFSKAFAMAGLRLGYVVASPPVVAQIAKLRNPFDVNELAVVAAEAQLADLNPMRRYVRAIVDESKPMMVDFFERMSIPVWAGAANFVLVKPTECRDAVEFLRDHGILVRSMSAQLLSGMFRLSMGSPDEMKRFIQVFEKYLGKDEVA
jgi:histidinol-phosphate aminotransferase